MDNVISINNLVFNYPKRNPILQIDNFAVKKSEHVFLHGPSGSGKTTFLGLVTGILPCTRGKIEILGRDICRMKLSERDKFRGNFMGYIFQMFNLIPYLTVVENISLPIRMNEEKRKSCPNMDKEIDEILFDLKIDHLKGETIQSLSIGQQQRVAAARSLVGKPKLIIADEPTSALDYDNRESFLNLLFHSAEKADSTILFVSHDHSLSGLFKKNVSLLEINKI